MRCLLTILDFQYMSEKIEQIFKSLESENGPLRQYAKAQEEAKFFRFFDLVPFSEVTISSFLFKLLDPQGSHGQKDFYLRDFCQYFLQSNEKPQAFEIRDGNNALKNAGIFYDSIKNMESVKTTGFTEYVLDAESRIDLLFKFDNKYFLGIENKPFAGDQEAQLKRYAENLAKMSQDGQYIIIYLCDWDPSESSLSKTDKEKDYVIRISFSGLVQWLKALVETEKNKNTSMWVYINELRKEIMRAKNMTENTNEIVNYVWENRVSQKQRVEELRLLTAAENDYKEKCRSYFIEKIRNLQGWEIIPENDPELSPILAVIGTGLLYYV